MNRARVTAGLAALALLLAAGAALCPAADDAPAGWGTLAGRVVWAGGDPPERAPIKVDKDPAECLRRGPLLDERYVVDPKTKGVRWVMVWLVDPANPKKALPTHPSLKEPRDKDVVMDQPCCQFEPRVVCLREGQELVGRNSGGVSHNMNIAGGLKNPNVNFILAPGGDRKVSGWAASDAVVPVSCNIHPWMRGWIRVFNHPYFAVTDEQGRFEIKDAPAGRFNLVVWQEEKGWVTAGGRKGLPVEIKAGAATDLGDIPLKP
jgi:hypothetical protein